MFSMICIIVLLSLVALPIILITYDHHHQLIKTKSSNFPHPPSPMALPIIGHLHLIGPLAHHSFDRLSSLYGPLIHLKLGSTPCVVASTPEMAKDVLKTNEFIFSSRKQSTAIKILTKDTSFAFSPYGRYWKFVKKMCTIELLGSRTLSNFSHIRKNELICFLRLVSRKAKAGEAVNVTEELLKLTNNVISEMMLSIRYSGLKGDADEARTLVREVTEIFGGFNLSDSFWFLKSIDLQGIKKRAVDIERRYNKLLENIIRGREKLRKINKKKYLGGDHESDHVKDFLDMLLDIMENKDSEIKLTRDHIKALILDFFTAATDTSAIAIEWALAELINNQRVIKRAQEEIDHVVGKKRLVSESDIPNLPYIQAIIKETLRLHPPIPMISRKSIKDCTINGYHIQANTLLFVNIWSIGRNPKYWEGPLEFWPDRFLGPKPNEAFDTDIKGHHFELLPFGTGRRGCPGISLAMLELPIVLAGMIQCFDWKVSNKMDGCDGVVDMSERPGLTAPRAHDLVCVPVPRNDGVLE